MATDPVKAKVKVLEALRGSAMDGYRLCKVTGLTEAELERAIDELSSVIRVEGNLNQGGIGERYFSILPSDIGRAEQTISILSNRA